MNANTNKNKILCNDYVTLNSDYKCFKAFLYYSNPGDRIQDPREVHSHVKFNSAPDARSLLFHYCDLSTIYDTVGIAYSVPDDDNTLLLTWHQYAARCLPHRKNSSYLYCIWNNKKQFKIKAFVWRKRPIVVFLLPLCF